MLRQLQLFLILFLASHIGSAQDLFPVKVEGKWGLMNNSGDLKIYPQYEAIGTFRDYGYAIMQRDGGVGLLNENGHEIVAPEYMDLKVLDKELIAVMDNGEWMVIDLEGRIILSKGYERLEVWENGYIKFKKDGYWGVVQKNGTEIASALYDEIYYEDQFFLTRLRDQLGILDMSGKELLANVAKEIKIMDDSLFFYRKDNWWGAISFSGIPLLPPVYDSYEKLHPGFISLTKKGQPLVYSLSCSREIEGRKGDKFLPFSKKYILQQRDNNMGLLNWCGNQVIPTAYQEILDFSPTQFRVAQGNRWGIVSLANELVVPFMYNYIGPLKGRVAMINRDGLLGLMNAEGIVQVEPYYDRLEIEGRQIKAYKGSTLDLFHTDSDGNVTPGADLSNHFEIKITGTKEASDRGYYRLENYEWFYFAESRKWGLRNVSDGSEQIAPAFNFVEPKEAYGFTLVGVWNRKEMDFERTTFRFEMTFGLVNNAEGILVTELDFWYIHFEDFDNGFPVARCIFSNGSHGLINRIGKVVRKDMAYIGDFSEGLAKVSVGGQLNASVNPIHPMGALTGYLRDLFTPTYMLDYTQYDEVYQREAQLTCQGCTWGFMDTTGQIVIAPKYSYVEDFNKGAAKVIKDNKWGLITKEGKEAIPCKYDGVEFIPGVENKMVKVYVRQPKFGMIDTLGQLRVSAIYDEIAWFTENTLAVKRNGFWGFVNKDGVEIIPCRYKMVKPFSEGLAAVQMVNKWGYINKEGKRIIEYKFKKAGSFNQNLALIEKENELIFIDAEQNVVIKADFDKAYDFHKGRARIVKNSQYGLIDTMGNYILKPKYTHISPFNKYGLAVVRYQKNGRPAYGVINLKGEKISRQDFFKVKEFSEGLAVVQDKNGYGYIDTTGRLVISCRYSKADAFNQGMAAVTYDGKCGYITIQGKTAIGFKFQRCENFDQGRAVVYKGVRRAGLIDLDGNYLIKPGLDRLLKFKEGRGLMRDKKYRFYYITENAGTYSGYFQKARAFSHGVAVVQIDNKWGIINQRGIALVPPKYDKIGQFENGYAKVKINNFSGLASVDGKQVTSADFELISYAGNGLFRAEKGGQVGYLNASGEWVWGLKK